MLAEGFRGWAPHGGCIITRTDLISGCLRLRIGLAEMRSQLTCPRMTAARVPFDISVTACIPPVYQHIVSLMKQFGIELIDTGFSYSVKYRGHV